MDSPKRFKFNEIINPKSLTRLDFTPRYSTIPVTHQENVSQHSYWVAMYSLMIHRAVNGDPLITGDLLTAALVHDLAEMKSGDIVRTFKYSSDSLRASINEAEKLIIESEPEEIRNLFKSSLNDEQVVYIKNVIKAADFVSLYHFMRREIATYNFDIIPFYKRMCDDINSELVKAKEPLVMLYSELLYAAKSKLCTITGYPFNNNPDISS